MVSDPFPNPASLGIAPGKLLFAFGWSGLTILYVLVFSLTGEPTINALGFAFANVAPAALLGTGIVRIVSAVLSRRTLLEGIAGHFALGALFVGAWYLLLIPSLAATAWLAGDGFALRPLTGPALPWQVFQGVMIYTVIAVAAHGLVQKRPDVQAARDPAMTRYLMRRGDEMRPVEVDDIISIRGADDYAEVKTIAGAHLARMTLQDFAQALPTDRFMRVHRSWIINFDRLDRAEPTGDGRLLLHMEDGCSVTTSRSGASLLRNRLL